MSCCVKFLNAQRLPLGKMRVLDLLSVLLVWLVKAMDLALLSPLQGDLSIARYWLCWWSSMISVVSLAACQLPTLWMPSCSEGNSWAINGQLKILVSNSVVKYVVNVVLRWMQAAEVVNWNYLSKVVLCAASFGVFLGFKIQSDFYCGLRYFARKKIPSQFSAKTWVSGPLTVQ